MPSASTPSASAAPDPTASPSPGVVAAPFDADAAVALATELAAAGPRPSGSAADAAARAWVAGLLRAAGWMVEEQPVPLPQGGTTANVIAWRGADPRGATHVVVGAHLDTVADSPGANDNASGAAALVVLARELADETTAHPVVLVAFGAEEYQPSEPRQHHLGSQVYADAHGPSVLAALSIDMVASGAVTCICWYDAGPPDLAQRLGELASAIGPGYEVRLDRDISDHGPFARRGIPAAFLWSGDDGRYHTPADTAEHLVAADLDRAGELALAWLRALAPAPPP